MSNYDYDLFVIGAGSGGVRSARLAASLGKKVAVAEEFRAGGTCVIRGCVPKKYLVYGAEFGKAIKESSGYGWTVKGARFDWGTLRDQIQNELSRLSAIYEGVLERNGAEYFAERAELIGPHTLKLSKSGREITAKHILIATGGTPFVPEMTGKEFAITSDDAFLLDTLPERVMVIGGGYIASEFAGIFAGLGAKTMQVYRGDKLLRGFDEEVREAVGEGQVRNGIDLKFGQSPVSIKKIGNGYKVTFDDGSQVGTDLIMMATGRMPNTQGLGLEKAGVKLDKNGAVIVDAYSKSNVKHIYAVGDVTNRVNLTPVAIREGAAFVETVYKDNPTAYDHSDIASAVFTMPPVGVVGLSEEQANAEYKSIKVYKTGFRPMKNILSGSEHRCFMKLITTGKREKVIGVHIVGDYAGEIIQAVGIAVKAGITKAQFDATCAVHPTLAEELVTL
ncbi:MAG: glutathione-disulfide reductase [Robiginitomaculum sp.]|nr:MAG: glutathione-disulfide reductase [Robiginitomaculum sp.]